MPAYISLLKVQSSFSQPANIIVNSSKFSISKFFSDGKSVSANHILQHFPSVENFPEWKLAFTLGCPPAQSLGEG
jgi:hypothetical protein